MSGGVLVTTHMDSLRLGSGISNRCRIPQGRVIVESPIHLGSSNLWSALGRLRAFKILSFFLNQPAR